MVCLDGLQIYDYASFYSLMKRLDVSVSGQSFAGQGVLLKACFTLPGLDKYLPLLTPLIVKVVSAFLLFLVLHFFYSLIPHRM